MPTYEYRCTDCGNRVEVFQRVGDDPLTICEVCGGTLRKVFHPAGIVFKGSGFYATDSRSGRSGASGDGKGTEAGEGKQKDAPSPSGSKSGEGSGASGSGSGDGTGASGSGASGSGSSGSGSRKATEKTS